MDNQPSALAGDMNKLNLSDPKEHKANSSQSKKPSRIADSWEDDMDSSDSSDVEEPERNDGNDAASSTQTSPRQASPVDRGTLAQTAISHPSEDRYGPPGHSARDSSAITKRPEKSTAAVRRMLAGSLGLKIRPSEETKNFERAQVANERKKREDEKRRVEEEKEARRSVWED
jgi:hypothetical protein